MQFEAKLEWLRNGQDFLDQRYSRAHEWQFDGGLRVPASSSPLSVPLPMSHADHGNAGGLSARLIPGRWTSPRGAVRRSAWAGAPGW